MFFLCVIFFGDFLCTFCRGQCYFGIFSTFIFGSKDVKYSYWFKLVNASTFVSSFCFLEPFGERFSRQICTSLQFKVWMTNTDVSLSENEILVSSVTIPRVLPKQTLWVDPNSLWLCHEVCRLLLEPPVLGIHLVILIILRSYSFPNTFLKTALVLTLSSACLISLGRSHYVFGKETVSVVSTNTMIAAAPAFVRATWSPYARALWTR